MLERAGKHLHKEETNETLVKPISPTDIHILKRQIFDKWPLWTS